MRYWKLIVIPAFIVLVTGVYYIQHAMAGHGYPEFKLTKVNGEEEVARDITVLANYQKNINDIALKISGDGAVSSNDLSYFDRLSGGLYKDPAIEKLQEEYRNFMRGKNESPHYFSKYGDLLAYVSMKESDQAFMIAVETLNTNTEDTASFHIEVPGSRKNQMIYMEAVELSDGVLNIFTRNFTNGGDNLNYYRIDMETRTLIDSKSLLSATSSGRESWTEMSSLTMGRGISAAEYSLFLVSEWEEVPGPYGHPQPESVAEELILVNNATGEAEEVEIPENLKDSIHTAAMEGSVIYLSNMNEEGMEVLAYNLESAEKGEAQQVIQLPLTKTERRGGPPSVVKGGKLYLAGYQESVPSVFVVDLSDGNVLYEGIVEAGQNRGKLHINELMVY
ncbi:hypothetical protein [Virgibacillus sediminis]|uniref:Uncharacterized protein n=1 Tax=Virgibacillus sediminis TaxID=202260 RepID=A0ABV7A3D1_9BACI